MKFAAVLRDSAADLPDTEDLFQKYKLLKKSLKRITAASGAPNDSGSRPSASGSDSDSGLPEANQPPANGAAGPSEAAPGSLNAPGAQEIDGKSSDAMQGEERQGTPDIASKDDDGHILLDPALEAQFLRAITADVMQLNERYMEKEEDNVITCGKLEEAIETARTHDEKAAIYRQLIDFHGELLMLLHWSILAYTGLVKILKKHRKRTGAPLHAPHLEHLLSQPFCSVEVTCEMVREAEAHVARLAKELDMTPPAPAQLEGMLTKGSESLLSPGAAAAAMAAGGGSAGEGKAGAAGAAGAAQSPPGFSPPQGTVKLASGGVHAGEKRSLEGTTLDGPGVHGGALLEDNQATRRVRAALNVWQQLQSNVSTPSTGIAAGVGARPPPAVAPSNMTDSSVA